MYSLKCIHAYSFHHLGIFGLLRNTTFKPYKQSICFCSSQLNSPPVKRTILQAHPSIHPSIHPSVPSISHSSSLSLLGSLDLISLQICDQMECEMKNGEARHAHKKLWMLNKRVSSSLKLRASLWVHTSAWIPVWIYSGSTFVQWSTGQYYLLLSDTFSHSMCVTWRLLRLIRHIQANPGEQKSRLILSD